MKFSKDKDQETKENSKLTKKRQGANNSKKNAMTKRDSDTVNEIQVMTQTQA